MAFDGRVLSNVGVLAAVAESGSFARAANTLGLTRSGVSRAILRLEERVGVRLFERSTRAVSLTEEGRKLFAEIAPLVAGIEDAVAVVSGAAASVRGRLRVNVDPFFSRLLFAPHAGAFLALYPELSVELAARDQLGDMIADGFDMAVRFGTPPTGSLVATKLLETRSVTVASPAYLARHGTPAHPSELEQHCCIQVRNSLTGNPITEWLFQRRSEQLRIKTKSRLVVDEFGTMLNACLAGSGIVRIKAIGIQQLLDTGALVELVPDWRGESFALHVLRPSRQLPPAKVGAFIDFLRTRCGAHAQTGNAVRETG